VCDTVVKLCLGVQMVRNMLMCAEMDI